MADNTTEVIVETAPPTVVTEEEIDLESAEPKQQDKPIEKTSAFSERLKEARKTDTARIKELEAQVKEYTPVISALKRSGYKGTPSEMTAQWLADQSGKTIEEVKAEQAEIDRDYEERKKSDPDFIKAQELEKTVAQREFEAIQKEHYAEIKAAFPDIKAKDMLTLVKETGQEFAEMLSKGISPVKAYKIALMDKETAKPETPPPSTGSTKSSGNPLKEQFFTREQVQLMSREEIRKNFKAISASEKNWK